MVTRATLYTCIFRPHALVNPSITDDAFWQYLTLALCYQLVLKGGIGAVHMAAAVAL